MARGGLRPLRRSTEREPDRLRGRRVLRRGSSPPASGLGPFPGRRRRGERGRGHRGRGPAHRSCRSGWLGRVPWLAGRSCSPPAATTSLAPATTPAMSTACTRPSPSPCCCTSLCGPSRTSLPRTGEPATINKETCRDNPVHPLTFAVGKVAEYKKCAEVGCSRPGAWL
jgi:hypothetical protein